MTSSRRLTAAILVLLVLFLSACNDPNEKKIKHYKRALEYIKIDDNKSAVIELKNAIQIDPKYGEARYQLGLLYLKNGDPRAAFGELQRTVTLDPNNLDAGVKVAEFYLLSRDQKQCRKYDSGFELDKIMGALLVDDTQRAVELLHKGTNQYQTQGARFFEIQVRGESDAIITGFYGDQLLFILMNVDIDLAAT